MRYKIEMNLIMAFLVFSAAACFAATEQIELSTYYPAPHGEYDTLSATNIAAGDIEIGREGGVGGTLTFADKDASPETAWQFSYAGSGDGDKLQLSHHDGVSWTDDPTNMTWAPGGNVGIGNENPNARLSVGAPGAGDSLEVLGSTTFYNTVNMWAGANVNMGNNYITGLPDQEADWPSYGTDAAVPRAYVDWAVDAAGENQVELFYTACSWEWVLQGDGTDQAGPWSPSIGCDPPLCPAGATDLAGPPALSRYCWPTAAYGLGYISAAREEVGIYGVCIHWCKYSEANP